MTNSLVHKVKETEIINDVDNDLQNYEINYSYSKKYSQNEQILTTDTLLLASPNTIQEIIPFIILIADYPVDLIFFDEDDYEITALKGVNYFAGNIKGYNFSITNTSVETANIKWRIYY